MDYSLKDAFKSLKDVNENEVEVKHQKPLNESLELKEGYVGQTVEEFLEDCVEADEIGEIVIADNDADDFTVVFRGKYKDLDYKYKQASFDDFDCGDGKLVINAEEDGEGGTYYSTVADFIDDYNGDEIEIQENGEVLFSGDKYDIPEELQEYGFCSFDAPAYICINAREIEESIDEELITEKFDESLPDWLKKELGKKHSGLKNSLSKKGIDLANFKFVPAKLPSGAWDPNYKRDDIIPVFYLNFPHDRGKIYIKGYNDGDIWYDDKWHTKKLGSTPIKTLIDNAIDYGYITTDESNFNTALRKQRAAQRADIEPRGKGQYKQYKYISSHNDPETGEWVNGHYSDEYEWITAKGEDKSGYKSKAEELKKRLYSADLNNYSEKISRIESKLENIRKEIITAATNADFKAKGGRTRHFGSNRDIEYVSTLSDCLDRAVRYYVELLDYINKILDKYDDIDRQNDEINALFSSDYGSVRDIRKYIEDAEEEIKEYHSASESLEESDADKDFNSGKTVDAPEKGKGWKKTKMASGTLYDGPNGEREMVESLEESWVNLADETQVEEEVAKQEKEKDEEPILQVVDPSATIVDELKQNYLGYASLMCSDCKTIVLKKPEELEKEIIVDPDTGEEKEIYNKGFECPHCGSVNGYDLLGQIATLNAGENTEEQPVEESEEEVVEEEPIEETPKLDIEEPVVEEEAVEVDESLTEALAEQPVTVTDFDEVSFDEHINKYLHEVYDNVDSYTSTDGSIEDNKIVIEGLVKFNNGKEVKTSFRFTLDGNNISGLNESFAKEENSYTIEGKIENNTFITENINYKYNIGEDLVEGCTKEPINEESNIDKVLKLLGDNNVVEENKEEQTNEDYTRVVNQVVAEYPEDEDDEDEVEDTKFEVLWYEGANEDEAKQGDPYTKEFDNEKDAMDYYNLIKDDEGKFGFWVTERDEDWQVVKDLVI